MRHPQTVFLFIILTLACAVAAFADAVIRPQDGVLDWTIVCGPDDGSHERKAADELASLVERMIGAKPKVVSVTNKSEVGNYPRYIAIGQPAVELGAVPPKSKFKIDGSVVVVEDNRILLAGESPVASYFAMTRLAEMAGCRWYMPGRLGECIPRRDSLTFKSGTYNEVPFMWQRALGMNGYNSWPEGLASYNQWTLHNRQGGVGLATGHAWADWLPPGKYFASHPEWFSGNDNERHPWGICMTNEEAVQEFINNIRKSLDASPGQTTISLSQDDGFPYCRCKNCDALNSGLRDPIDPLGLPHITDSLVHFYNRVATEVEKTHPGIRYGFLAYLNSLKPPVKEKLHPALVPQIAPMHYSTFHPINSPRSESIRALGTYIDGWSKLTEAWSYYGYGICMAGSGMPYVREIETRHDWPYMADRGLKYVCIEFSLGWQNLLPYHYLIARLNLDPYADPEPIVSEFYTNFFGPAAADMRAYLDELNVAYDSLEHEAGGSYIAPLVFTPERMKKLGKFLKSAERKAKGDPILKERVAMWRFGYRCVEERMRMRSQINRFRFQEASDTADRIWALFEGQKTANPETICPLWWEAGKNEWKGRANVTAKALKGANILYKFPDEWLVFLDYARAGAEKKMYAPNISLGPWRKVKTYSTLLSEQGFLENYGLYMWYRNTFQLKPEDLKGKTRIHFAEVDHTMWSIYVNGKKVDGQGLSGWTEPFDFDITDFVKPGENLVVCEIEGTFWEGAGGIISPVVIYSPAENRRAP